MSITNSLISVELATKLQQLSNLAHKENKSDDEINELKEVSKNTLAAIDDEVDNVSIISKNYINEIRGFIADGNWNALPTASKIRADLQLIKSTLFAINESMNFISIDIESIIREIMKIHAETALLHADQRIIARILINESDAKNIKAKTASAEAQLQAEVIKAGFEIGTGVVQGAVAVGNLAFSVKTASLTKDAKTNATELEGIQEGKVTAQAGLKEAVTAKKQVKEQLKDFKKSLEDNNISTAEKNEIQKKIAECEKELNVNDGKIDNSEKLVTELEHDYKTKFADIETKNAEIDTKVKISSAISTAFQSFCQTASGIGGAIAAGNRYVAALGEVDAEFSRQASASASSVEQSNTDAYQSHRNAINELRQMASAMEQAYSRSLSATA